MHAEAARKDFVKYSVNTEYTRAALFFSDQSFIEFEHTSRDNRWARASANGTIAHKVCQSLRIFRLNAKHLQLFFEDGTNAEFFEHERVQ
jgi:hypothetical protein